MEESIDTQALWDLSIELYDQRRYDDAIDCMLRLKRQLPKNSRLMANLGMAYRDNGDLDIAEEYLRNARKLSPEDPAIRFNLALTWLRDGRLKEGFREYECRWQLKQFAAMHRKFEQPLWGGEPLEGRRILIYGEQGAGDSIQFVRYAPLVQAVGGVVIVEVLPHVERLMRWMDGGYEVVNALTPKVRFDLQCPMMTLPQRFDTELCSIPAPAWFSLPPAISAPWTERLRSERKRVGVVWAGNPLHPNDCDRSLPADALLPLTRLAGVKCWSLQVGPSAADTPAGIIDLSKHLPDFAETAAAISAMDLVITVDTAVAHLAGSLGKPVWLLLAYASDWRWMLDREDSPWYPSMKIFRQKVPREWNDVIERVAQELAA